MKVAHTECNYLDSPGKIQFIIASRIEDVRLIGLSVNKLCSSHGISEMDTFGIELCVVEAVTNSIEHAYHCEGEHQVRVVFSLHRDRVEIEVRDQGTAMDSNTLEQAGYSNLDFDHENIGMLSVRGRGLSIMKEMMNKVSYQKDGEENCLTMIKELSLSNRADSQAALETEDQPRND